MTRPIVSGNLPAEYAERITDTDEGYTPAEEEEIEARANEIIRERLARGDISELLDSLDYVAWVPDLQRAISQLLVTQHDKHTHYAVSNAIWEIIRTFTPAANRLWRDDAREQAEKELNDEA